MDNAKNNFPFIFGVIIILILFTTGGLFLGKVFYSPEKMITPTIIRMVSPSIDQSKSKSYCTSKALGGPFNSINDCGDFKILVRPCCDQQDIIIDNNGNKIAECGGIAGYSPDCKKRFSDQSRCTSIKCTTAPSVGGGETKEECLSKGGTWSKWGLIQKEYCQYPAKDAGKSCTDGSECSMGKCISYTGKIPGECKRYENVFGCFSFVTKGQTKGTLCVD